MKLAAIQKQPGQFAAAEVILSRRNTLALLCKSYAPESAKTLTINGTLYDAPYHLTVRVEPDERHYANRPAPPGPVQVWSDAAMQIAVDLLQQVADALPDDEKFMAESIERSCNHIGYLATQFDHGKVGIV